MAYDSVQSYTAGPVYNDGGPVAMRLPEMGDAFDQLTKAQIELDTTLERLRERLSPVIVPAPPRIAELRPGEKRAPEPMAPLTARMYERRDCLLDSVRRVQALIDQLAV